MRPLQHACWLCLVAGLAGRDSLAEEQGGSSGTDTPASIEVRVLDVVATGGDRLRIGTNTMSLAAATDLVAAKRDTLDLVAVHGSGTGTVPVDTKSSAMEKIASVGVPLVVVEDDGEFAWREHSGTDGVRTVTMGTDQVAALRRLWRRKKAGPGTVPATTVQTTVQWDAATGTHELSQVELGLFGKRVWLMHERRESDDEGGTTGIRIKKEW